MFTTRKLRFFISFVLMIVLMAGAIGCSINQSLGSDSVIANEQGNLTVHFIDVGQGAAQLIIGPTGKVMLIDGGNNDDEERMVQYLRDNKVEKVDILIGTHPDADHVGGLDAVIDHFDIGKIYMPKVQANTKTFESVLLSIKNKGLKVSTAKAGLTLDWEQSVTVNMIAPVNQYEDKNNMSAVVHMQYGSNSFLFTGDAEIESEEDLIKSGYPLKSDVMLIGHHGSTSSTSQAYLDKVKPTYAVIQVGENNYGHPKEEILERLKNNGIEVLRTDLDGTIIISSNGKNIQLNKNHVQTTDSNRNSSENDIGNLQLQASASIDHLSPSQYSTVNIKVEVKDSNNRPVAGAKAFVTLHFKSTNSSYEETTNADGIAVIPVNIGRATIGYTVNGDITITFNSIETEANISFTPQ